MSAPNVKVPRNVAIRIDVLTTDIHRIWSEVPSTYVSPKKLLNSALVILYSDSKKACKILEKAKAEMKAEAELAYDYNRIRDAVIQSPDSDIRENDRLYRACLDKADFTGAKKALNKLMSSHAVVEFSADIEMKFLSADAESVVYDIKNVSDEDITVSKLVFTCGPDRMDIDMGYPFIIRKCTSQKVTAKLAGSPGEVHVHLEYTSKGMVKQINAVKALDRGSKEDS